MGGEGRENSTGRLAGGGTDEEGPSLIPSKRTETIP